MERLRRWIVGSGRLFLAIVLIFSILVGVVAAVSREITVKMSDSAVQNLSESLDLIQCTIESILRSEVEFQQILARELGREEDPEEFIRAYERNRTMVRLFLVRAGESEGISNTGEPFFPAELDFSLGGEVDGMPVSQSYLNFMGTWAYCIKCPVETPDGVELGTLYVEYVYDTVEEYLPEGFYNQKATLYVMDANSERFVLKPKGMGMRSAGHLNLEDFYRANDIQDQDLRSEVEACLEQGDNILFYHDIRDVEALNYMWAVNGGTIFLVGYVPVEAIQQEGRSVNHSIFLVVFAMMVAFLLCCGLYFLSQRKEVRLQRDREAERELHSRQLAEALHAAQVANNSKTVFLSNMSHDIRTPMNAVLGFTSLLERDAGDPAKVREYTRKITASGQHLLSLINDILDVSKIESGKVVLNIEKFSLNDVVSSVDAIIQSMARTRHQSFHVEVSGVRHEYLMGDETRLNQILINILSNAVKYTQEGGDIWFRILGQKQRSSQFEHIRIEVEDNGYGMTPEYLEVLFDAFTRAENSTTNKVQGTGLGMAITKSIVELMGGTIEVSSQVDQGTLFRVDLEFRIPEDQAERQFWRSSGIRRVLYVGGGENCVRELLGDVGVQVDEAASAQEAWELASKETYQLAILDWDDPAVPETQPELRGRLPEGTPVLRLTGRGAGAEDRQEDGDVLEKPFFAASLREKLRPKAQEPPEDSEDGGSLEGLRFLCAEDNEINAEILEELLDMAGMTCEVLENGKLALERFQRARPGEFAGILMDVQMPVMNGYEATRAIRALDRPDAKTIPIIAMTANAFVEDERAALDAGMNAHVAKPIDMELLTRVIRQYTISKQEE